MRLRGFLLAIDPHDVLMLERAFSLAERGRGCTSPNPVVGAVIVRDAQVIGEGYHVGPGRDHAEIAAMKDALRRTGVAAPADSPLDAEAARAVCEGATIYVTLEPCCTFGRTPPCTSALGRGAFRPRGGGRDRPEPRRERQGHRHRPAGGSGRGLGGGRPGPTDEAPERRAAQDGRHRTAVRHVQVRHDRGRPPGHRHRRFPLDIER